MKAFFLALLLVLPLPLRAEEAVFTPIPAAEADLAELEWVKHALIVFGTGPEMPAVVEQLRMLEDRWPELDAKNVAVIVDTDPAGMSDLRRQFRPNGFQLILIGADGEIGLRRPTPRDARELLRTIDRLPMVREERRMNLGGR